MSSAETTLKMKPQAAPIPTQITKNKQTRMTLRRLLASIWLYTCESYGTCGARTRVPCLLLLGSLSRELETKRVPASARSCRAPATPMHRCELDILRRR